MTGQLYREIESAVLLRRTIDLRLKTMSPMRLHHSPVLVQEVTEYLKCQSGGIYVDCTIGGGGHAEQILKASKPDGRLVGLDRDPVSVEHAKRYTAVFGDRVSIHHENFTRLDSVLDKEEIHSVDGILLDLGLSSTQLEDPKRGFSFLKTGPLDMRMDQTKGWPASDLINRLDEDELTKIFREFGEERWAVRISRLIVRSRKEHPIDSTGELSALILRAIPRRYQRQKIHPATRVFQALRIAVNDELTALQETLHVALRRLKPFGRLCVISFHSLEDRIVKHTFRAWEKDGHVKVITKRPIIASAEERMRNPRSRSAKLRVAERCSIKNHFRDL
jgi:16S rRNA (cytosine1402-N4)-methyltransferase